jgi:hypothetical protein
MFLEQQKPNKEGIKKRYEILDIDETTEPWTLTLKGLADEPWKHPFDKAWLKRMGYALIQVEDES